MGKIKVTADPDTFSPSLHNEANFGGRRADDPEDIPADVVKLLARAARNAKRNSTGLISSGRRVVRYSRGTCVTLFERRFRDGDKNLGTSSRSGGHRP